MNPKLEIFSQGEEIITGQVVDSNAAWLSQQAVQLGFSVTRHTAVGDRLDDLVSLLKEISERADCCICSGGLGPTCDDLTAEAVAAAFDRPLILDEQALEKIKRFFEQRNRVMPETNRKQALLPKGSVRLDNDWGTAPGFALQKGRCWFFFVPGVPSEMRHLYRYRIKPVLNERFALKPSHLVTFKTLGLGESSIQARVDSIFIPSAVQIGFCVNAMEVQTKLLFPFGYPKSERDALCARVSDLLADDLFAIDGFPHPKGEANSGDLISVIDKLMLQAGHTLSLVESASHGLLASLCVGVDWLNGARIETFNPPLNPDDLQETAQKLLDELKAQADCRLVQLYTGSLRDQSPITLYNALLTDRGVYRSTHSIIGSAERKQNQAAAFSLDLLRRYLQGVHRDADEYMNSSRNHAAKPVFGDKPL